MKRKLLGGIKNTTRTCTLMCKVTAEELEEYYTELLQELREPLENVSFEKLCDSTVSLKPSVMKHLQDPQKFVLCVSELKLHNISGFIGLINVHGDYLNPSLLEYIVERHGNEKIKEKMKEYKGKLQQYKDAACTPCDESEDAETVTIAAGQK